MQLQQDSALPYHPGMTVRRKFFMALLVWMVGGPLLGPAIHSVSEATGVALSDWHLAVPMGVLMLGVAIYTAGLECPCCSHPLYRTRWGYTGWPQGTCRRCGHPVDEPCSPELRSAMLRNPPPWSGW